jgi:hypothetical protein
MITNASAPERARTRWHQRPEPLLSLYRVAAAIPAGTAPQEKQRRLREAVTAHTAELTRAELVELVFGLAALFERFSAERSAAR